MESIYQPPESDLASTQAIDNNSGMKQDSYPDEIKGWSWGAFFLNWIWAIGNKSYIGLLALIPYVGFIVSIYLGLKGRQLAWKNKRWDSIEHFIRVQKRWSIWGVVLIVFVFGLGMALAIAIPAYHDYSMQ
jgi:hypothetical protein